MVYDLRSQKPLLGRGLCDALSIDARGANGKARPTARPTERLTARLTARPMASFDGNNADGTLTVRSSLQDWRHPATN